LGRVLLAVMATLIVARGRLIRVFLLPGLILMPIVFGYAAASHLTLLYGGIFVAGMLTVGQFSFWGNYLPRVYPVHLRGTGESFAANIGGRMIGASFAALTNLYAPLIPGGTLPEKIAVTAAAVAFVVTLIGFLSSYALPEPPHDLEE